MIQHLEATVISRSEKRRLRKTHIMKDYQSKFNKVLELSRAPFGDRTQEIKNQSNPMPNILDLIPKSLNSPQKKPQEEKQDPVPTSPAISLESEPAFIDINTLEDKENYEPLLLAKLDEDTLK